MPYRLAIFDFDGTLADSFPFLVTVMDSIADKHRLKRMDHSQVELLRGMEPRTLMKMHSVPIWKTPLIARTVHSHMAQAIERIPLFPGVREALHELAQRGVILAVVSSNAEKNIRAVLGENTASLFSHFECGVSMFGKAGRMKKIVRQSRAKSDEAIAIGDEIRDAEAALKAGVAFGAVAWGYAHLHILTTRSPQVIFESVDQLVEKIAPLSA